MTSLKESRELALKFLFCQEFSPKTENIDERISFFRESFKAPAENWNYAVRVIKSTTLRISEIDAKVQSHLDHWKIDRISLTDKNIIRIAVSEFFEGTVPGKVVIDEAIRMAKKYSTEDSSSFINGVLDSILKEHFPED